jgi:hypothetical protein
MSILNQLFSKKGSATKPDTSEKGFAGTQVVGGYIVDDEKDPTLSGNQKFTTYSNVLLNTSTVSASVRYYLNLITKAGWRFTPSEDDKDKYYAEMVEEILGDMLTPWHRVTRRAAMYRFYGYSVHEWTAKVRPDGVIGFKDISARPQKTIERWEVDEKGRVQGVYQRNPNTGEEVFIPRWKMMYVIDDSINDSPEGVGLFRHLVYPTRRLMRYEQLEGYGFESDLRGVPLARAPLAELNKKLEDGEIDQAQYSAYLKPIKDFLKAHVKSPRLGMMLDSAPWSTRDEAGTPSTLYQWSIELLRGSPTSLLENAGAIERINLEMARIMGTEHLLIGGDGKGSMALSTDKSHNFALIVESSLKEVGETTAKDIVDKLFEMNNWDPKFKPEVEPEPIRFRSPEQITSAILDLARSGAVITPEDPIVDALRDVLNLPRTTRETLATGLDDTEEGASDTEDGGRGTDDKPDSDSLDGVLDNIKEDMEDK